MLAVVPALIGLLTRLLDILTSEQVQSKLQEIRNERQTNDARKALLKGDSVHISAVMAEQHDRVQALCGGSGG